MRKINVFVAGAGFITGFWLPGINSLTNFLNATQKGGKDHE
jgi:hypothetical protein